MSYRSSRRRRFLEWGGRSLLVAALVALLYRFDDGSVPRHPLFHPEAIYPAALYADLDHWRTWTTPFAPYFVPDVALFFFCMGATGDPIAATYAYGALQFLLLIAAFCALVAAVVREPPTRRLAARYVTLAGAWAAVFFSLGLHGGTMLLQLFVAAFHTGSFVLSVFGLAIVVRLLSPPAPAREPGLVSLLFLVSFLGVLSDRLLLAVFVLPAIIALVVYGRRLTALRRSVRTVVALAAGALLGLGAGAWWNAADLIRIAELPELDPARYLDSLRLLGSSPDLLYVVSGRFFERLGWEFRAFWLLWLLATAALILCRHPALRSRAPLHGLQTLDAATRRNVVLCAVYWLLSFATTALATNYVAIAAHGGHLAYPAILFVNRYLISTYATPLFAAAFYAAALLRRRWAARLEVFQVAVLAGLIVFQALRLDLGRPFPSYRPAPISCLDEKLSAYDRRRDLAPEHGAALRHGLAHFYFHARTLNTFSRRGLHADQVTAELEKITWIASRERVGERTGYHFVVTNRLDKKAIIARIGPPDAEIQCNNWNVFVYDEPVFPALPASRPRSVSSAATRRQIAPAGTSSTPSPGSPL